MPTEAELKAWLTGDSSGGLLPQTTNALQPEIAALQRSTASTRTREQARIDRMTQGNVPLDVTSGDVGDNWARFFYEMRGNREAIQESLQNEFGKENVRLAEDGTPIIRVVDAKSGKPKDVLLDPEGMSAADFLGAIGVAGSLVTSVIGARMGRKLPLGIGKAGGVGGAARDIVAGSVGAEAGNVALQGVLDAGDPNLDVDPSRTFKEGGVNLALDIGIGGVSYPVGRFFQFVKDPLKSSRGQVQFNALEAKAFFKQKYGIDVPLSIGEQSGSPLFARTETFIEKLPGGSGPVKQLKAEQEAQLQKLQSMIMGTVTTEDETLGRQFISELQRQNAPVEAGAETAGRTLATKTQTGIMDDVTAATKPGQELELHRVGQNIRNKVETLRNVEKAESDRLYGIVNSLPGGTGKVFDATDLAVAAEKVLGTIPKKGSVPIKDFAPDDVINRLRALADLKGEKMSLGELQQMRRDTYEAIPRAEGVPGRGAHYLNEVGKMLTDAMEKGVASMPGGKLKAAWDAANKQYREKVVPFNRVGITELFRAADEPGFMGDTQIFKQLVGSPDKWRTMKETLGETSAEFVQLKRAVADDILQDSMSVDGSTIEAKKLFRALSSFKKDNREIAEDVFGPRFGEILEKGNYLQFAEGDKLPADVVDKMLKSGKPLAGDLKALVEAQKKVADRYKNRILKQVGSDEIGDIKPSEFVTNFIDRAEPSEVRQVLGMLSSRPGLLDDIRAKAVENVFRKASGTASVETAAKIMAGEEAGSALGTSVAQQFKDKNFRQKMKDILGPEMYNDVEQYVKLSAARDFKEEAFSAAGGISAGSQIATLTQKGPLKYLTGAAKDWVASKLLTSRWARAMFLSTTGREKLTEQPIRRTVGMSADFATLLLSNPAFLRMVTEEMPGTKGENAVRRMKDSIDAFVMESQPTAVPETSRSESVRAWLEGKEP